METKKKFDKISQIVLVYALLDTLLLFVNDVTPLTNYLIVPVIAASGAVVLILGRGLKYSRYIKELALLYLVTCMVETTMHCVAFTSASTVTNNLMLALNPLLWIVLLNRVRTVRAAE